MNIQSFIEQKLNVLVGKDLVGVERDFKTQKFHFGNIVFIDEKGEIDAKWLYELSVDCFWNLYQGHKLIVGQQDIFNLLNNKGWEEVVLRGQEILNVSDVKLKNITSMDLNLTVTNIEVDAYGRCHIYLTNNYSLFIVLGSAVLEEWECYWRLNNEETNIFTMDDKTALYYR